MTLRAVLVIIIVSLASATPACLAANESIPSSPACDNAGSVLLAHFAQVKERFKREFRTTPEHIPDELVFYERCRLIRNLMLAMHEEVQRLESSPTLDDASAQRAAYWRRALATWRLVIRRKVVWQALREVPEAFAEQIACEFEHYSIGSPWPDCQGRPPFVGIPSPTHIPSTPGRPGSTEQWLRLVNGTLVPVQPVQPGKPGPTEVPVPLLDSLAAYLGAVPDLTRDAQMTPQFRQAMWKKTLKKLPHVNEEQIETILENVSRNDLRSVLSVAEQMKLRSEALQDLERRIDVATPPGHSLFKDVVQKGETTVDAAWLSYQLWREGGTFSLQPLEIEVQGQRFRNCFYRGHDVLGGRPLFIIGPMDGTTRPAELKLDPKWIEQIRLEDTKDVEDVEDIEKAAGAKNADSES